MVVSSGRLVLQLVSDSLDKYLACILNFCTPSLSSMEFSLTDISLSLSLSLCLCSSNFEKQQLSCLNYVAVGARVGG